MDCRPPGFSIHGIFQAWVLEWVAISFSRGSSWPGDWTWVSHIAGRRFTIWATREKEVTEDEMVGWYHWLNGHEFEQTMGDSEGQASLACCSPWGRKESDTTWQLNNSNKSALNTRIPETSFTLFYFSFFCTAIVIFYYTILYLCIEFIVYCILPET